MLFSNWAQLGLFIFTMAIVLAPIIIGIGYSIVTKYFEYQGKLRSQELLFWTELTKGIVDWVKKSKENEEQ